MREPVEQISQDDVIIRQQRLDREQLLSDRRPASFSEYLQRDGANPVGRRPDCTEGLAELAERAKRAPRDG